MISENNKPTATEIENDLRLLISKLKTCFDAIGLADYKEKFKKIAEKENIGMVEIMNLTPIILKLFNPEAKQAIKDAFEPIMPLYDKYKYLIEENNESH